MNRGRVLPVADSYRTPAPMVVSRSRRDLVVEGIMVHRSGFPQHPKEVLIMGEWRQGETVLERQPLSCRMSHPTKYRILFTISGEEVRILNVRHGSRRFLHEE